MANINSEQLDYEELLSNSNEDSGYVFLCSLKKRFVFKQERFFLQFLRGGSNSMGSWGIYVLIIYFFRKISQKYPVVMGFCGSNFSQGAWFLAWVDFVLRRVEGHAISYTNDLLAAIEVSKSSFFYSRFLQLCVFSAFCCWYFFMFFLMGYGWLLLLMVRVAVYTLPIAFLFANMAVPGLLVIIYVLFWAVLSSCVLKFLVVVLYQPVACYLYMPLSKVFLKISGIFVKVLDPIVYEAQYWKNTLYHLVFVGSEYFGSFLLRCYLRYVLESESILWSNTMKDVSLFRYKLKVQMVHLWRWGLRDPVVEWVLWYVEGQVGLWRDSLFKGFFFICEGGSLWNVGNMFSIVPSEQYPHGVKVFFFFVDRGWIVKWENFFYSYLIYVVFVFFWPVHSWLVAGMFFFHMFCYYVVSFCYSSFYRMVFWIFRFCSFHKMFPACIVWFVEFDEVVSYVGYCYTWYTWLFLRTVSWLVCKMIFCFISLPERFLALCFLIVNGTWELCMYLVINRMVFFYFALPMKYHEFTTGTGEYADCYSLWKLSYLMKNSRSIIEKGEALAKKRRLSRKKVLLSYLNRFAFFSNASLSSYWFFWTGKYKKGMLGVFLGLERAKSCFFFCSAFLGSCFCGVSCSLYYFMGLLSLIFYVSLRFFLGVIWVLGSQFVAQEKARLGSFCNLFLWPKCKNVLGSAGWIGGILGSGVSKLMNYFFQVSGVVSGWWVKLSSSVVGRHLGFLVSELKVLLLWMYLVNPSANLSQMEGSKSFLEVIIGALRIFSGMMAAALSTMVFEMVLFFKSMVFFVRAYQEEKRVGRGFMYQFKKVSRGLKIVALKKRCKEKYNKYKFYLDLVMFSFVFTPNELEEILLPKGKRDFKPGDYVAKVDEWYASQSEATPRTFGEFMKENLAGEQGWQRQDSTMCSEGSVFEEAKRRHFLWTYRHFFSIWTRFGFLSFIPSEVSEFGSRPARMQRWFEW